MKSAKTKKINTIQRLRSMFNTELASIRDEANVVGRKPIDIMLMILFEDGHIHGIYPHETVAKDLTFNAIETLGLRDISDVEVKKDEPGLIKLPDVPRRVVLHNRQAIGDILMFTCAVRDLKAAYPDMEIKVQSTAMHLWDHNENICHDEWELAYDPISEHPEHKGKPSPGDIHKWTRELLPKAIKDDVPIRLYIGPSRATNSSNKTGLHFANAYRMSIEDLLGIRIPQGPIRPDIYLTQQEFDEKPLIEPPYWLITAGEKGDWTCKTFYQHKWQEVVSAFPRIKFVQLGAKGHPHPDLRGDNVVNFIGQTDGKFDGIRRLFNLFNYCEGSMGLVSFQMHLAAGFGKPCVVVAGAREPVSFTRYNGHQYLSSDGCLPCTLDGKGGPGACWFCKIERCPETNTENGQQVPKCVDVIKTEAVVDAIHKYYAGGRLTEGKPLGRSTVVNVVKASNIVGAQQKKEIPVETEFKGFSWSHSTINPDDWNFLEMVIKRHKVKKVLEFGCGISTLMFNKMGIEVLCYETNNKWADKVRGSMINPDTNLHITNWDSKDSKILGHYDLAFVDGPAGGNNREHSTRLAAQHADIVIQHDAARPTEKEWAKKYLIGKFKGPIPGGGRCYLWVKGPHIEVVEPKRDPKKKVVKMLFNGRGEGGAERSTTWLMNSFIEQGWEVDYVSPNERPSGTFRKSGDNHVRFYGSLDSIGSPCDLFVLYSNDWVWEFAEPDIQVALDKVQAKRKVFITNFRIGKIGEVPWTRNFDKYLFLNSGLETALKERLPWADTFALAPPTDLTEFLGVIPDYDHDIRIVRHSSQGDTKYPKNFLEKCEDILSRIPGSSIHLMPGPSWMVPSTNPRIVTYKRNQPSVVEFLSLGNVFWYHLPDGYEDQGPKVIMEAQAVGLPVVADNHSGAKDRVVSKTGFLCDNWEQHIRAFNELQDPGKRQSMGTLAKGHAKRTYDPQNWIDIITGVKEGV